MQGSDYHPSGITRRGFVRVIGLGALAGVLQACQTAPTAPPAAGSSSSTGATPAPQTAPASGASTANSLVVALTSWGTETPIPWRSVQAEKPLWDVIYDELVWRDPKTYQFAPGLALSWENSPDFRTWTFHLRQGVMFHETWGEFTSDDVKFTVEKNLNPELPGGDVPWFRAQLDGIEAPDKYTVVMHFKSSA